jgi:DNA polymerase-3 subunit delta
MSEISYRDLKRFLKEAEADSARPLPGVCLIHGEDLFVRTCFEDLLQHLLPQGRSSLNCDLLEGASAGIGEAVARANTYSLLGGAKVVALRDARLFHSREDAGRLLEQARQAHQEGDVPRAARHFLASLAQMNLALEDMAPSRRKAHLPGGREAGEDSAWIDDLLGYCADGGLSVPSAGGAEGVLEAAIEKGFPEGHHLVITTDLVDRRRSLFKTLSAAALVVDCSVPKGERKADKDAQAAALADHMKAALAARRKVMNREAFLALCEMTGFNPGTFTHNLDMLIDYTGERREITAEDVDAVLTRTKKDPLYELTNAMTERDWGRSLHFLDSLLAGDTHGLQVLAAVANQVRKLLVAKDFVESPGGRAWQPSCGYPQFQKNVMPAVAQHDRELLSRLEGWERRLADAPAEGRKKKTSKVFSDLVLAKNPANAFPVYQVLRKSDRFTRSELMCALEAVAEADLKLKSSTLNPRLILERVLWQVCHSDAR